jgi:hypothetical protein
MPPELPDQVLAGMALAAGPGQLTLGDAALAATEAAPEPASAEPAITEEAMRAPDEPVEAAPLESAEEPAEPVEAYAEAEADHPAWQPAAAAAFEPPRRAEITFPRAYDDDVPRSRFAVFAPLASTLLWSYVWLGVSLALAIYLGIAAGDSLRGGGGDAGPRDLGTGFVRNIPCDNGPLTLTHGTSQVFQFDPSALHGFEIDSVTVTSASEANRNGLTASAQGVSALQVQAARVQAPAARSDEFLLQIEWQRGDEGGRSNCTVVVNVTPSASP